MSLSVDTINKSINDAIYFISSIQDSCDKHRVCLENRWFQEYTLYLTDWKQAQNEIKKLSYMKHHEENSPKDDVVEEIEELVLADSLLGKARMIRSKNQKVLNGFIDFMNISRTSTNSSTVDSKNLSKTADKYKITRKIPQSKSDFIAPSHKNMSVRRSKSASVTSVPKENEISNNQKCSISSKNVPPNNHKHLGKRSDCVAVISNKERDVLNRICAQHLNTPTSCDMNQKKNLAISDSSEYNQSHHSSSTRPTSKEFISSIKDKLSFPSSFVKLKLWYPYLSSRSEKFLATMECKGFHSFHQTYSMLHSIQEMMMWIDILYLIEKEVYPNLISCNKDVNALRMYSCIMSLFHPTHQRIPILDPNG